MIVSEVIQRSPFSSVQDLRIIFHDEADIKLRVMIHDEFQAFHRAIEPNYNTDLAEA